MVSKADHKGHVYVDLDGFMFGPVDNVPPRSRATRTHRAVSRLHELTMIHYLLRSRIMLDADSDADSWAEFQQYSRQCLDEANHLVGNWHMVPNPAWIGDLRQGLKDSGKADASVIDGIGFSFPLSPKIQAYSFPSGLCVELSAITTIHLRTINLLLWTVAANMNQLQRETCYERPRDAMNGTIRELIGDAAFSAGENFIDLLLPYLFSLYFPNANYSALPIPRVADAKTLQFAKAVTQAQLELMVAHECAHLLLHQGMSPSLALEREADIFAYELLFDTKEFWKDNSGLFFTACRWFFLYLALDRIIGSALSGYEVDWVDIPIRHREMWIDLRISDVKFSSEQARDCQPLGDALLFQAKAKLRERGIAWIVAAARQFEEQFCIPTDPQEKE